jgi:5'-nucleotidase
MNELFLNRRTFVKKTAILGAGTIFLPQLATAFNKHEFERLVVLHTNDMHSRIEPFTDDDIKFAGLGGMEKRAAIIEKIRKLYSNVLLLDAGDIFQGTPYFNFYGGEPELRLMSAMKYDAATMGNHDFDNGLEGFANMLKYADFPFVCSNYDFNDTILYNKTKPYIIIHINTLRVGIFGLGIQLNGLVAKKNYGNTIYNDPINTANYYANFLKHEMKCHLIICLSHLGYKYADKKVSDIMLAEETNHINLIIGGHTHTFLNQAQEIKNKSGKKVLVNQAGWGGIQLGRIDFIFDKNKKKHTGKNDFAYISYKNLQIS